MIYFNKKKNNPGFTIIEVLFACAIISVSVFAVMQTAQKGIQLSDYALKKSEASFLLEEGAEAVKSIRDNNWTTISSLILDIPYHLYFNTSTKTWGLDTNTTNLIGCIPSYPLDSVFDRTVTISSVGRDINDDILTSGGTIDPKTKKVTVTATWTSSGSFNTKSLSFYISDIFN
jgi:type II secretory pathway pseudopilin PulG